MADVTGRIGNEEVELNNAATEATLRQLLSIAKIDSKNLIELAKKAGVDAKNLKDFDEELKNSAAAQQQNTVQVDDSTRALTAQTEKNRKLTSILGQLDQSMTKLMDGNAQMSDMFSAFSDAGPLISTVALAFERLASIQQKNFEAYQKLTDVGVGFSGSLTEMRMAAANSYLTLEEFQNVIKNNSKMLSMLGGTADEGARNFAKLSNTLIKSEFGTYLTSMGYTTEQVNTNLANYITMSGGRSRKELQNTEAIVQASAAYMENLDGLSRITGESREQMQAQMKEQAANAAWQAKLATMSEADKQKALAGMNQALAIGGKGAVDAFQAKIMGVPPLTKEAQMFAATMSNANSAIMKSAETATDSTKTMADMNESFFDAATGIQVDMSKFSLEQRTALIASGGVIGQTLQAAGTAANKFAQQTDEQRRAAMEKQKIEATQAADMANAMKGLKELGAALWTAFSPLIGAFTTVFGKLGEFAGWIAKWMEKGGDFTKTLAALSAATALYLVWQTKKFAAEQARSALGAVQGVISGGAAGGAAGGAGIPAAGSASGSGVLGGLGAGMKGAAAGLRAFANPMVIAGAAGFGIAIAAIGAGIAGAAWLMGKALPTLAEGLMKFTELDGAKLGSSALGIGKLGLGLITFAPIALWGIPAGFALNSLADGVVKLNSVDPAKLEKVALAMEKVKAATPSIGDSLRAGIAGLVGKVVGTESAAPASATAAATPANTDSLNLITEVRRLNTVSAEILKYMKETADYAKRNVDATKSLSGDLF